MKNKFMNEMASESLAPQLKNKRTQIEQKKQKEIPNTRKHIEKYRKIEQIENRSTNGFKKKVWRKRKTPVETPVGHPPLGGVLGALVPSLLCFCLLEILRNGNKHNRPNIVIYYFRYFCFFLLFLCFFIFIRFLFDLFFCFLWLLFVRFCFFFFFLFFPPSVSEISFKNILKHK